MNEISGLWALIDLRLLIVCRISKAATRAEEGRGEEECFEKSMKYARARLYLESFYDDDAETDCCPL